MALEGLIVAGVGVSAGVLTSDIYTTVIIMVALTTIITPIWLKKSFKNELASPIENYLTGVLVTNSNTGTNIVAHINQ